MVFIVNGDTNLMRHSEEFNVREVVMKIRFDCNFTMRQYADWSFPHRKRKFFTTRTFLVTETHIRKERWVHYVGCDMNMWKVGPMFYLSERFGCNRPLWPRTTPVVSQNFVYYLSPPHWSLKARTPSAKNLTCALAFAKFWTEQCSMCQHQKL